MDQERRTRIARGGLSLLLAGGVVGVVALAGLPVTTALLSGLVGVGVACLLVGVYADRPVAMAVWLSPVVAAVVLALFGDAGSDSLLTQAALLGVIGVAQVIFSQVRG
ncbi:hypothetical protein [Haloarchaeobius sp. HRN-SO-5]|uniref:hypothetical protein n=1 Tax=Haloarchaeobius sp. HRN-SO-5 TaxID=3446118 RepID=UPI003EB6C7CE